MKKENLFKTMVLLLVCSMVTVVFNGCSKDDEKNNEAPESLSGKTMNYKDMTFSFSSSSFSIVFNNDTYGKRIKGTPNYSYSKTENLQATLHLHYVYEFYSSLTNSWIFMSYTDDLTLFFDDPNSGTAIGTSELHSNSWDDYFVVDEPFTMY